MSAELPESTENVAKRMRLTRMALRLSQSEIARQIGIQQQVWNNAETGDNRLSINAAVKLYRTFQIDLMWTYFGEKGNLTSDFVKKIEAVRVTSAPVLPEDDLKANIQGREIPAKNGRSHERLLELLVEPMSAGALQKQLGLTRQRVDQILKDLMKADAINRIEVFVGQEKFQYVRSDNYKKQNRPLDV